MSPAAASSIEGAVLVLEGHFNPRILSPQWLHVHELITGEESTNADVRFFDPELTRFQVAGYAIEARRDQVTIASTEDLASFRAVGDFATQIFQILIHTPITGVGMNLAVHWPLAKGGFDALSEKLAPPGPWKGILESPRIQSMTINDEQGHKGPQAMVTIEPSTAIENGVYIIATQRVEVRGGGKRSLGARGALKVLEGSWHDWMTRANDKIISAITELA